MGLKVTGLNELLSRLSNTAERSSRGAREELKAGAEAIMQRSKSYAPVDEGNLEDAHQVVTVVDDAMSGRHAFEVGVREDHPASGGKEVGDYAFIMHEGVYNLGPKSQEKNAGFGKVGRKFMERAFIELTPEVKAKVEAAVAKGVGH